MSSPIFTIRDDPQQLQAGGRRDHHALARQMFGKRLARRFAPFEGADRCRLRHRLCPKRIFRGRGLEFLELELQLLDQPGAAFGALPELLAPQLGELELEVRDHRLGGRHHRLRLRQLGLGGRQLGAKSGDFGGVLGHGRSYHAAWPKPSGNRRMRAISLPLPAAASSADCASLSPPADSPAAPPRSAPPSRPGSPAR